MKKNSKRVYSSPQTTIIATECSPLLGDSDYYVDMGGDADQDADAKEFDGFLEED